MIKIVLHDQEDLELLTDFIELIVSGELGDMLAEDYLRKRDAS